MTRASANRFQLQALRRAIKPFRVHFFSRLRSTNDHAAKLRRSKRLYAPAIVLAARQTKGRGRGENVWHSGTGSLTVTFVLPADPALPPHQVPLIAGLAVYRALVEVLAQSAPAVAGLKLKWPNDLWHDDLKIAGLLCERVDGADLVGVGLNVNLDTTEIPSSLRHKLTSLAGIVGRGLVLQDVLATMAREIDKLLLKRDFTSFSSLLRQYNGVHALSGRSLRVTEPGGEVVRGVCEGLDAEGRLLVRTPQRLRRIVAGHVELS